MDEIERLMRERDEARAEVDAAYLERNQLVALLSKVFPAGLKRTEIPGWSPEWHGCVFVDFPWGQASWHYHERDAALFAHLGPYTGKWDGHTTEEKYKAIAAAQVASYADLRAEVERLSESAKAAWEAECVMRDQRDRYHAEWKQERQEVKRLREKYDSVLEANVGLLDGAPYVDARAAFRRGAEAMREACQQWCRAWENDGEAIADALADLRVEDKP